MAGEDILIEGANGAMFALDRGGPNWSKIAYEWKTACMEADAENKRLRAELEKISRSIESIWLAYRSRCA